eukprot:6750310-Lingulodinium_polyedra.AAC.1
MCIRDSIEKARKALEEYCVNHGPLDSHFTPPEDANLETEGAAADSWRPSTARRPDDDDPGPGDLPPGTELAPF